MKKAFICCLALLTLYLNGCASIVSSSSRNITITTEPDQAKLEIVNVKENISILKANTPHTLNMDASAGFFQPAEFQIKLSKDGYIPQDKQLNAKVNGWYFGNVVFGGLLGILIVDPATGAMWKFYDDKFNVKLYKDTAEGRISMAREVYNGIEAMESSDYNQVIADTSKGIALYPDFLEGYIRRSTAYEATGEKQKAEQDLLRLSDLQPADAKEFKLRAEFFSDHNQVDKAMQDFNKALELDPNQGESFFSRGQLYLRIKNIDKAKQDIYVACQKGYTKACHFQF